MSGCQWETLRLKQYSNLHVITNMMLVPVYLLVYLGSLRQSPYQRLPVYVDLFILL